MIPAAPGGQPRPTRLATAGLFFGRHAAVLQVLRAALSERAGWNWNGTHPTEQSIIAFSDSVERTKHKLYVTGGHVALVYTPWPIFSAVKKTP